MSEHVRVERDGPVMALVLDRPDRRNAITVAMYAALADAIGEADRDPEIRLVTFRGEGQDFAAGNDLADFMTALPRDGSGLAEDVPVWRLLNALATCSKPLVAAVHGNCVGIGTTMLLHCDLVIAEDGARFSLPFVALGLVPEAASSLLLPRLAGPRHAARYFMLGEKFGADEALAIGVASHKAAPGELRAKLDDVVARLLAQPAQALAITRRLLRQGNDDVMDRMREESALFADRLQSDEVKQAIMAFFASRGRPAA